MNWYDLIEGDVVVPIDNEANAWLVLRVEEIEGAGRSLLYMCLGTGRVHTAKTGASSFLPTVKVLRNGDNVNK